MQARIVGRFESGLPPEDAHPYRTGAWKPQYNEWDAEDLEVLAGEVPRDLEGVYLRNTENPVLDSLGRYHPFDGDGMLHAVGFEGGRAWYRNRFVRTEGLAQELAEKRPLWAGIAEGPEKSLRDGWGARTRMKDASSTDVVVHNGVALTTFYQCGDAYRLDPRTLAQSGRERWGGAFPSAWGISAHPKVDERTGELLFFSYSKQEPYLRYGVVSPEGAVVHTLDIPLPGPRLPHDMAFTERYALLNDLPLHWDESLLARGIHRPRFYADKPSRFCVVPRRGDASSLRWFEASPTYVLHWINAWEEGDEVVLDGYHQSQPMPEHRPGDGPWSVLQRSLDMEAFGSRPHRWRFNLRTGATKEERLDDRCTEFPMLNARYAGLRHRYFYAMTGEPGWFLFNGLVRYDLHTGAQQRYAFPRGVFASESPMAPRLGSRAEDDGYVLTLVTDTNTDSSECQLFDAADISRGPVARLRLPERVSSGTHACWAPAGMLPPR